jgi:hypothetical protein
MSIIIGAKKKAQELPLMSGGEIKELIQGSERLLEQGVPLEVPAAVRVGDLVRISSTMKKQRELLVEFVDLVSTLRDAADEEVLGGCGYETALTIGWGKVHAKFFDLEKEVEAAINIAPPPLVQPSPLLEV